MKAVKVSVLLGSSNCETFCSRSVKNAIGCLIGIALNLKIALGSIVISTMLILPMQEHGISPSVCIIFNFLHQCLMFSAYRSFVFSGRFIPRYFILFVAMVNGSVFLISLSDFSSLVDRKSVV